MGSRRANQTTGDWGHDPWFVDRADSRQFNEAWEYLGLPLEKRVLAESALRRIFPPELVLQIAKDLSNWFGPVSRLFEGIEMPHQTAELLDLGVNAAETRPWEDRSLLLQLQKGQSHHDAAFEVACHASLLRAGADVTRVPASPSEKRFDFEVSFRGRQYDIEVKLSRPSDLERLEGILPFQLLPHDVIVPGMHLVFQGSESLAKRCRTSIKDFEASIPSILEAFAKVARRIRETGEFGTHPVEDVGFIIASPEPGGGSLEENILPAQNSEKDARRVVRKIQDGLEQLPSTHSGVLVIGLNRASTLGRVESIVREDSGLSSQLVGKRVLVVLCKIVPVWPSRPKLLAPRRIPVYHAFQLSDAAHLQPEEIDLAIACSSTHWDRAVQVDHFHQ